MVSSLDTFDFKTSPLYPPPQPSRFSPRVQLTGAALAVLCIHAHPRTLQQRRDGCCRCRRAGVARSVVQRLPPHAGALRCGVCSSIHQCPDGSSCRLPIGVVPSRQVDAHATPLVRGIDVRPCRQAGIEGSQARVLVALLHCVVQRKRQLEGAASGCRGRCGQRRRLQAAEKELQARQEDD